MQIYTGKSPPYYNDVQVERLTVPMVKSEGQVAGIKSLKTPPTDGSIPYKTKIAAHTKN
jgi:hypothetical protein